MWWLSNSKKSRLFDETRRQPFSTDVLLVRKILKWRGDAVKEYGVRANQANCKGLFQLQADIWTSWVIWEQHCLLRPPSLQVCVRRFFYFWSKRFRWWVDGPRKQLLHVSIWRQRQGFATVGCCYLGSALKLAWFDYLLEHRWPLKRVKDISPFCLFVLDLGFAL